MTDERKRLMHLWANRKATADQIGRCIDLADTAEGKSARADTLFHMYRDAAPAILKTQDAL